MDIEQQRPGLLLKQLCFLGWKCPVFLQVQLWYLSINFLQILGTATAVLPFSPEHPLPPALPHPAISVPQGTLGCSSLSICPVFCACSEASEDTGMEEREASCPGGVFRQDMLVSCTWRSGGELRVGSWGCQEGNELPGGFCWRLAEEKQGGGGGGSCSHQNQQTLGLSSQSLCCR